MCEGGGSYGGRGEEGGAISLFKNKMRWAGEIGVGGLWDGDGKGWEGMGGAGEKRKAGRGGIGSDRIGGRVRRYGRKDRVFFLEIMNQIGRITFFVGMAMAMKGSVRV